MDERLRMQERAASYGGNLQSLACSLARAGKSYAEIIAFTPGMIEIMAQGYRDRASSFIVHAVDLQIDRWLRIMTEEIREICQVRGEKFDSCPAAYLHADLGRYDAAEECLLRMGKKKRRTHSDYMNATAAASNNDFEIAEKYARKLTHVKTRLREAKIWFAVAAARHGRLDLVEKYVGEAGRVRPEEYTWIAEGFASRKDYSNARAYAERNSKIILRRSFAGIAVVAERNQDFNEVAMFLGFAGRSADNRALCIAATENRNYARAEQYYDSSVMTRVAEIEANNGDFERAERHYETDVSAGTAQSRRMSDSTKLARAAANRGNQDRFEYYRTQGEPDVTYHGEWGLGHLINRDITRAEASLAEARRQPKETSIADYLHFEYWSAVVRRIV